MSLTGSVPFKLYRPLALSASGTGVATTTLSALFNMDGLAEQFQDLNGGVANRDVTLPAAGPENKGVFYAIMNRGLTNSLVVKDVAATVATLLPGDHCIVASNGANWKVLSRAGSPDVFTSAEQTGTGASQNVAHGLGQTPRQVWATVTDSGTTGIYTLVPGAHDATNAKFTVTSGVKFIVFARE